MLFCQQISSKEETRVQKLILILTTSMLMTAARKKVVGNTETTGTARVNKNGKYLGINFS